MTCRGTVANGVVVVDSPVALPEGAAVSVRVLPRKRRKDRRGSLAEKLSAWGGRAKGLPADLAQNHDHYLYGLPKR